MRRLFPLAGPVSEPSARHEPAARSAPSGGEAPGSTAPEAAEPSTADRQWSLTEIADGYAYPPLEQGQFWLRGNMVASLDGAAHHDGRSQPLSCAADMRIFGVLRALADVVVVGAQTVRQEGYGGAKPREAFAQRRAAAGQTPAAAIAVVTSGLDLDFDSPLFTSPTTPTLLVTGAGAPPDRLAAARGAGVEVVLAGEGAAVEVDRVPALLGARGLRRQLTEGGPALLGQFAAADVLDELCLTVAPRLVAGGAPRIAHGPDLELPSDFALDSLLEEAGFLFTRYRRVRQSPE
ncbi:pyrimidine reductase family protein [Streptomyces sp. XM4193]|uniref:pyrimidine reductase family protein n=1 Tax=Streptomyces sp. XM4193 TaxID=2929782 RepID=UPI001FFB2911|nr:pyrimidine reductase family protein [Streptomyces sp. XM4193]MCK1797098.1 pyrimidine reductase family protein [Streptomyces sp. XM4193]